MLHTQTFSREYHAYSDFNIIEDGEKSGLEINFSDGIKKREFMNSLSGFHFDLQESENSIIVKNLIPYLHEKPGIIGFANATDTREELHTYKSGWYLDLHKTEGMKMFLDRRQI